MWPPEAALFGGERMQQESACSRSCALNTRQTRADRHRKQTLLNVLPPSSDIIRMLTTSLMCGSLHFAFDQTAG
jgi:hypothetical protein